MGRIATPKYVVRYRTVGAHFTPAVWKVRTTKHSPGYGRPNVKNLRAHLRALNESFKPGGANEHLGTTVLVWAGEILNNRTGEFLCRASL